MGKLVWTRERPGVAGAYKVRFINSGESLEIAEEMDFFERHGILYIGPESRHATPVGLSHALKSMEFAGPLPPPGAEGAE